MNIRSFFKCTAVGTALLCAGALQGFAQAPGGGGAGRGGMGVLTQEQRTKIRETIGSELTPLRQQLVAAEKAAAQAALASDATEGSVKAKFDEVAKVQAKIAVVRFKGIKAIASTLTSEQKTQLEGMRDGGYNALFGMMGGFGGAAGGGRGNRTGGGGGNRNN